MSRTLKMSKKSPRKRISLVVADDHEVIRVGIRMWLGTDHCFEIIGEAASGREAVALAKKLKPNVVMMDLSMPSLTGVQATHRIVRSCPEVKVIVFTTYGDRKHVRAARAAGASGYVLKSSPPRDLIAAVHQVYEGGRYLSPSIAHHWEALVVN